MRRRRVRLKESRKKRKKGVRSVGRKVKETGARDEN